MKDKIDDISKITKELITSIGEDLNREGLERTPMRVAKAWDYFTQGYSANIDEIINEAIFDEECNDMVVVRDIEFFSMCEHHMIPFFGKAHVGLSLIHI